ncbi:MAG: single-stranded-DNA-specific exonuclease RecJ [Deltaproteobacteria bacterium]|nr:single-stranded-DNA-specific exonuclease RecJ [Deltaproteobacteria bacterium]
MTNNKIWRLPPPSPYAPRLASETGISVLNAQLLINRGISDGSAAKHFLSPRISDLIDPMLLKDMDKALDLILEAIEKHEHITVYGDYDADGLTSTALLMNFFSDLEIPTSFYIPDRLMEGYSLNPEAVQKIAQRGTGLIITVDCGISNMREIDLARRLGMKVVVTDHHQIPEDFDPICPVINPRRPESSFPFRELAGVGVAFFLAIAIRAGLRDRGWFRDRPEPDLKRYLDLVALGTVADMVPLIGQNRTLVRAGMEEMRNSQWPGIKAMLEISGVDSAWISSHDLAFRLAPRLNAPGRIGDVIMGMEALTTDNASTAMEAARQLSSMNSRRQVIEGDILEEIEETIIPGMDLEAEKTMVLAREGWHKGVLGIVASRLLDRYHRPTLILTVRDGMATGSGRSIDGFNLYNALNRLGHLFERFGGHYHAAGFTLKASNIDALKTGLEEIAQGVLSREDLIPAIDIDAETALPDLTMETVREIRSLSPFGSGNPEPVLYSDSLKVVWSGIVGESHLKLRVKQGETVMEAIGFGLSDRHPLEGKSVNMVFVPEINRWQGYEKPQLRIIDLELQEEGARILKLKAES